MIPASDELKAALRALGYTTAQIESATVDFFADCVYVSGTRITREDLEDNAIFRRFMDARKEKPARRIRL